MNQARKLPAHQIIIRLLILAAVVTLALIAALATTKPAYADLSCVDDIQLSCLVDDTETEDSAPDCGKNPYLWNPIGEHYQRQFSKYCEPFTGDPNESLYDGLWFDETPLAD